MARTKKNPSLAELEAKLAAEDAAYQQQLQALQAQRDSRKKALAEALKQQQAAEQQKRKGDLVLLGNKVGALAVKLGIADLLYDGELSLATVETALRELQLAPVRAKQTLEIMADATQWPRAGEVVPSLREELPVAPGPVLYAAVPPAEAGHLADGLAQ